MLTVQAYLKSPKTRKVLSSRPGDEGFSLIELVVVVAVLAILAAIAIPAFTSINDKAATAAAQNTIAQIAKECAVKKANGDPYTFNVPKPNSYTITPATGDCTGPIVATKDANSSADLPTSYTYTVTTGLKTCVLGTGKAAFCTNGVW